MNDVLNDLSGGDLRCEGCAADVAARVIDDPERLADLAEGIGRNGRLVRARTFMCLEVMSRTHPELLKPLLPDLVRAAGTETVPQARWHLAEIFAAVPSPGDTPSEPCPCSSPGWRTSRRSSGTAP